METRFQAILKKINIPKDLKEKMKTLYKALCEYAHPSKSLIVMELKTLRIMKGYVESEFDNSLNMHTQTCDVLIALILLQFPVAVECFKQYLGSYKKLTKLLTEHEFIHTRKTCDALLE